MTDKELLEYAAKAAGMTVVKSDKPIADKDVGWFFDCENGQPLMFECGGIREWKPLTDDGDALRLAVRLHLCVTAVDCGCMVTSGWVRTTSGIGDGLDVYGATRRAIVRAAAEIGKAMP